MKKSALLINYATAILLLMCPFAIYSQTTTIKVRDSVLKYTYESYTVLKADPTTKEGEYTKVVSGNIFTEGTYHNNDRVGIWKWYNDKGEAETVIDYGRKTISYTICDTITHQKKNTADLLIPKETRRAVMLITTDEWDNYLMKLLMYPMEARENSISGKVIVSIGLDSLGKITGYTNYNNAAECLYNESIRVFQMIPFEFLPAYENGKPVASIYKFPVTFMLQ